jgi:hypothetical protein
MVSQTIAIVLAVISIIVIFILFYNSATGMTLGKFIIFIILAAIILWVAKRYDVGILVV